MGRNVRKPVFGVSDKVRLKPACSATETSLKIGILLVASLDMILYKRGITKTCAGWSTPLLFANPEDRFSRMEANMDGIR